MKSHWLLCTPEFLHSGGVLVAYLSLKHSKLEAKLEVKENFQSEIEASLNLLWSLRVSSENTAITVLCLPRPICDEAQSPGVTLFYRQ